VLGVLGVLDVLDVLGGMMVVQSVALLDSLVGQRQTSDLIAAIIISYSVTPKLNYCREMSFTWILIYVFACNNINNRLSYSSYDILNVSVEYSRCSINIL
jgi:hypothetical protein